MQQFLIQGLFFQNQQYMELACVPKEGVVAVIHEGLFQYMYAGLIWTDERQVLGGLKGEMQDQFGHSRLSRIQVSDLEISFTKKYDRRDDEILYKFRIKDGNSWIGEYNGDMVGSGTSRCIITEVPDSFFDGQDLARKLGRGTAHSW